MDADENKIIIKIVAFPRHFLRNVQNVLCVKFLFLARTAAETDLNGRPIKCSAIQMEPANCHVPAKLNGVGLCETATAHTLCRA